MAASQGGKMKRWIIGLAAMLLGLAVAVPARAAEKVTFGYFPVSDFLMAFIAKDQGFFDKHGIDATLQLMANNATSIPGALVGNSIQVGATTLPVVLQADENGLDVKMIAGSGAYYPGFHAIGLVVAADSDAKTAKDMEGKTIGLTGLNNLTYILLVKWLKDNGADVSNIHFVEVTIQQMPDVMKAKQLDGVVAIEPFLSRIIGANTGRVFAYYQDAVPRGTATLVWAVAGVYAAQHPDVIKNVRAALDDALAYHQLHPENDDTVLAHYLPVPPAILKTIPRPDYVNKLDLAQIGFFSTIMVEQKLLTKPAQVAVVALP
jgi:NitT/TauT family transport system substrate-binding protein